MSDTNIYFMLSALFVRYNNLLRAGRLMCRNKVIQTDNFYSRANVERIDQGHV